MKNSFFLILLTLMLTVFNLNSSAQDVQYSQFYAAL